MVYVSSSVLTFLQNDVIPKNDTTSYGVNDDNDDVDKVEVVTELRNDNDSGNSNGTSLSVRPTIGTTTGAGDDGVAAAAASAVTVNVTGARDGKRTGTDGHDTATMNATVTRASKDAAFDFNVNTKTTTMPSSSPSSTRPSPPTFVEETDEDQLSKPMLEGQTTTKTTVTVTTTSVNVMLFSSSVHVSAESNDTWSFYSTTEASALAHLVVIDSILGTIISVGIVITVSVIISLCSYIKKRNRLTPKQNDNVEMESF